MQENKKYWEGIAGVFICNICNKPLEWDEKHIGIDITDRFQKGSLNGIGHVHIHEECIKGIKVEDLLGAESAFDCIMENPEKK